MARPTPLARAGKPSGEKGWPGGGGALVAGLGAEQSQPVAVALAEKRVTLRVCHIGGKVGEQRAVYEPIQFVLLEGWCCAM